MIYVVQPGDTLWRIARQYGVTVAQIAALNQIPDPDVLVAGQALLILNRIKQGPLTIDVGGYAYPYISPWVLRETLPFLSQLAVFSYGFTPEGRLLPPALADGWLAERAAAAGVRPALVLTPLGQNGQFSNYLVHALLQNSQAQIRLLEEIRARMALLGYRELNIDFEYVLPEDRESFAAFVKLAADTLEEQVSVCLAPKSSREQRGLLYEGMDYRLLGQAADRVLLMTYECMLFAHDLSGISFMGHFLTDCVQMHIIQVSTSHTRNNPVILNDSCQVVQLIGFFRKPEIDLDVVFLVKYNFFHQVV